MTLPLQTAINALTKLSRVYPDWNSHRVAYVRSIAAEALVAIAQGIETEGGDAKTGSGRKSESPVSSADAPQR